MTDETVEGQLVEAEVVDEGNGQAELIDALIGTTDPIRGRITLMGDDITRASVRHRREAGIGFVPQDRQADENDQSNDRQ